LFFLSELISQTELSPEEIYEKVNDAVVIILVYDSDDILNTQGSGVIINSDGYVLTNYHVLSGSEKVKIMHGDLLIEDIEIVGGDKDKDFLVLKMPASNYSYIPYSDSSDIKIGQRVYAIGSPLGYENTISEGIISGYRKFSNGRKLIQITTSISSGSSGGAVVNSKGELIGISTYTVKEGQNINFAIPINDIMDVEIKPYEVVDVNMQKQIQDEEKDKKQKHFEENRPSNNPQAIEYLNKGKKIIEKTYLQQNQKDRMLLLKKAIKNFDKAIRIDSSLVEAYYLAGKYQASPSYLYNYENAKNYYRNVERIIDNSNGDILISVSNREILVEIAGFYYVYGQFEERSNEMSLKVIEIYKKALEQPLPYKNKNPFYKYIEDDYIYYQISTVYHLQAISFIYNSEDKFTEAIQYSDLALEYYKKISSGFKEDPARSKYYDIVKDKKLAESLWLTYDWKTFYSVVNRKAGILISANNILYLYHPETIIKEKNVVRTWVKKVNLNATEIRDYGDYDYAKSLYEFDLKNNKYRVLQYVSYYKDEVLDDENYPNAEWEYIVPGTIVESMMKNLRVITK